MADENANTSTKLQVVVFGWREHIRQHGATLDNTAGKERRGLWGAALGWDTRHGMPEHGMVWVGKTSETGWDTFH